MTKASLLTLVLAGLAYGHELGVPKVSIRVEGEQRVIESNGLPAHATGAFPNSANPHAIRALERRWSMPARPGAPGKPRPAQGQAWGVALNGVPLDPGTAEYFKGDPASGWQVEALGGGVRLGLDVHRAHVQPDGSYHYHGLPTGLVEGLGGGERMLLLGWAADGYPVYGPWAFKQAGEARSGVRKMAPSWRLKQGQRPGGPGGAHDGDYVQDYEYVAGSGDLDECNGRSGVTPEFPKGTYYYVVTEEFPYIPRCWRGEPDPSFRRPLAPPGPPPKRRRGHIERPRQAGGGPF